MPESSLSTFGNLNEKEALIKHLRVWFGRKGESMYDRLIDTSEGGGSACQIGKKALHTRLVKCISYIGKGPKHIEVRER